MAVCGGTDRLSTGVTAGAPPPSDPGSTVGAVVGGVASDVVRSSFTGSLARSSASFIVPRVYVAEAHDLTTKSARSRL